MHCSSASRVGNLQKEEVNLVASHRNVSTDDEALKAVDKPGITILSFNSYSIFFAS